jgi:hypothetical protein
MYTTETIEVSLENGDTAKVKVEVEYQKIVPEFYVPNSRHYYSDDISDKCLVGWICNELTPDMKWANEEIRAALQEDYIIND